MKIIDEREREVWYKMCCNEMKQQQSVIKTVKDANN